MSNNLTVNKHGVAQALTSVEAVQIYGATGGNVKWVDENEAVLKGKFITANGTYKAEDDGALGYKRVVVMSVASAGFDAPVSTKRQGIAIKEGGKGRVMNAVKKIAMQKSGSGELLMVPKPNITTKTLSVTAPGVYDIATDPDKGDAIAYSQVTVNVSDADRDAAGFNPENPTYMDDLPTEIRVIFPPSKIGYKDGEEIDFRALTVEAYRENGTLWTNDEYPDGIIPLDELIFPITVADFGSAIYMFSDGAGLNACYVDCNIEAIYMYISNGNWVEESIGYKNGTALGEYYGNQCTILKHDAPGITYLTRYNNKIYAANIEGSNQIDLVAINTNYERSKGDRYVGGTDARAGDGVFSGGSFQQFLIYVPESTVNPLNKSTSELRSVAGQQIIPVQWMRPVDNEILESQFDIIVDVPFGENIGYEGATGGGGQTSGGGAGRND